MTAPPLPGRLDTADLSLPERPRVSVVISVSDFCEEHHLARLLESLDAQTYGADAIEVLVCGDGLDHVLNLIANFRGRFQRFEIIDQPGSSAVTLNEAMRRATGDCWVTLSGTGDVESDFVAQSVDAARRTGAACVGGAVEPMGEGTFGKAIAAAMTPAFGSGQQKFRYAPTEGDVETVLFGCYHRKVWEIVGEFDESIDVLDEDSYNARVLAAGGRIVLVKAIRSSYSPRQTFREVANQYWENGTARGIGLSRGRPVRPRDFLPSALVLGLPVLFLLSRKFKLARWAFRSVASYVVSNSFKAASSAAGDHEANPVLTYATLATMHASYGVGFIRGAVRGLVRR